MCHTGYFYQIPMNTLDLLLLIPIVYGGFKGYKQGLLIEIVGILAFVLAMVIGFKFLNFGMDTLAPHIGERFARRILPYISFAVIFFPTIYLIKQVGFSMRSALRYTLLGSFDSLAGCIVGGFTWLMGMSTSLWLLKTIGIGLPEKYTFDSLLHEPVAQVSPLVIAYVSDWIPIGGNLIKEWLM